MSYLKKNAARPVEGLVINNASSFFRYAPPSRTLQYGSLAAVLIIISNWHIYLNSAFGGMIPLFYYAPIFVISMWIALKNRKIIGAFSRDLVVYWFIVYALTGAVWVLFAGEFSDEESRLMRARFLSLLIFSSGFVLARICNTVHLARVLLFCFIIAILNNWIDLLNPYLFYPPDFINANPGRGSGFYLNANQAGQAVVSICITTWPFIRAKYRNLLMLALIFGVIPTFSRSAIMAAVILTIITACIGKKHFRSFSKTLVAAILLTIVGMTLYDIALKSDKFNPRDIQQRIEFILFSGAALDESAVERIYAANVAYDVFSQNPFFGNGLGSTLKELQGRGVHNMYLVLSAEQGIFFLVLYLLLLVFILVKGWRMWRVSADKDVADVGFALVLMAIQIGWFGFFSHTILDDPFSLFLLAILFAFSYARKTRRNLIGNMVL